MVVVALWLCHNCVISQWLGSCIVVMWYYGGCSSYIIVIWYYGSYSSCIMVMWSYGGCSSYIMVVWCYGSHSSYIMVIWHGGSGSSHVISCCIMVCGCHSLVAAIRYLDFFSHYQTANFFLINNLISSFLPIVVARYFHMLSVPSSIYCTIVGSPIFSYLLACSVHFQHVSASFPTLQ